MRSLRSREKIARQAESPVPPVRKSLRCNVGQTVPSVNSVSQAISLRLLSAVLCALVVWAGLARAADFAALQPQGYVSDYSGVIDSTTRAALEQYCAKVEAATGAQIAVLTIPSLQGEPLEDVANAIFRKWGIGKKGADEGALLLLVTGDRRMRLEVGYGLEPMIPDGFAGSVLRTMSPALRESRYGEAVVEGVRTVAARIAQAKGVQIDDSLPPPQRHPAARSPAPPISSVFLGIVFLIWLLASIGGRGRGGRSGGSGVLTGLILGSMLGRSSGGARWGGGFGGFDSGGGGGFGGFGGGSSGGGGASGSW